MTRHIHYAVRLATVATLLVVCAPGAIAKANVPPAVTKTNTMRVPALGNAANGTLTTKLTYTNTAGSATASTGNTIGLGRGFLFRLRTCVAYHLNAKPPVSNCAERTVDTRSNAGTVYTFAPTVTLSGKARPITQPWAYFTGYAEAMYLDGSSWPVAAHSWPDNGLQGAGIPIAAQAQTSGTLPANATVLLDGPFTGAVNSGQPDSICTPTPTVSDGSPLPTGVSATHPGFTGAPAYYEVGLPTGAYAGTAPFGVMLVIHGGAWMKTAIGAVQSMRPDAARWRARGWETVNITYRGCAQTLPDVLWFYDKARAWFGTGAKLAALGTSAGAHLALMIGTQRPDLYAAVSQAGPTNLSTIQSQPAYDATTGQHTQTFGGRWAHNIAAAAFGEENLPTYSPVARVAPLLQHTRVLQGISADDPIVPNPQVTELADAMRAADPAAYADDVQLATGTIPFGHGLVTQAALDDFYARELQLVAPVDTPTVPLDGQEPVRRHGIVESSAE